MSTRPMLADPKFSLPFGMSALGDGIGVVLNLLMQNGHLVAFESWNLKEMERGFSIYDREMLAIMYALDKF